MPECWRRLAACLVVWAAAAGAEPAPEHLHFIVPGGAGGGWDRTARVTGDVLVKGGLLQSASFENLSGGGSGKAIGYLIKTAERQHGTLLVNSVPIIVRSISGVFPFSFRDLTPIASVIGDYGVIAVLPDSPYQTIDQLLAAFLRDPLQVRIGGGSVRGDLDHIVAALAIRALGADPRKLIYVPYDTGGKAVVGLLTGEIQVLSTGLGEALEQRRAGQMRILAVTAPERLSVLPQVPALSEYGENAVFANWRGFFGPPQLPAALADRYAKLLQEMQALPGWEAALERNGWVNFYRPRGEFAVFLEEQEALIAALRKELGFY
ncbi:tripartite tricarboxylate transporter substrate binding protein [Exilibacterium tricleocarpae]|uniref:tripartite tricarboxylate transporter substrate binding protein n=1 Tax=Exilibacterium tricleocarpae TaxID=2591008 RepID=UPI001C555D19|nr:tripartite tricarboxylate transporter substrate-binding protein [Exilibacterium tricleocarpae]